MKSLTELNTDRATFSIGKALSDGWNLVSKSLGYYILGGIITVVISLVLSIIPIVGGIANQVILAPCLMAGAVFVTWRISKGIGWADFGDMFKGFNFLSPIVVASVIQFAATLILTVLFLLNYLGEIYELYKLAQGSGAYNNQEEIQAVVRHMFNPMSVLLFLLLMLVVLFITLIWAFKIHFIVIYKMQAWPAMEMSRKIATNNLVPLIGFFLLMGLIIIVSALFCGIGLLFSLPLMIGATYSIFAQITHCDQPDEINEEMFDFIADSKS